MVANLFLAVFLPIVAAQPSKAHFERQNHFDAVWMNYGKLFDLVQKAREFAFKANGGTGQANESVNSDSLRLNDSVQSTTVDFAPDFGPADLDGRNMPSESTSMKYEMRRPRGSPISRIAIEFGGWGGNSITVQGSDQTQVEAVSALLLNSIGPHTTIRGNLGCKFVICIVFGMIGLLFLTTAMSLPIALTTGRTRILLLTAGFVIEGLIFSGSIERALPSCRITDSLGWLHENNPLFTFLSLILAVVIPALGPLWRHFRHHSSRQTAIVAVAPTATPIALPASPATSTAKRTKRGKNAKVGVIGESA